MHNFWKMHNCNNIICDEPKITQRLSLLSLTSAHSILKCLNVVAFQQGSSKSSVGIHDRGDPSDYGSLDL